MVACFYIAVYVYFFTVIFFRKMVKMLALLIICLECLFLIPFADSRLPIAEWVGRVVVGGVTRRVKMAPA